MTLDLDIHLHFRMSGPTWHLVAATGMTSADDIARIGVASDSAGVAFTTAYGAADLVKQAVKVRPA